MTELTVGERAIAVIRDIFIIAAILATAVFVLSVGKRFADAQDAAARPAYCFADDARASAPECEED